jgi:hypothetical protein
MTRMGFHLEGLRADMEAVSREYTASELDKLRFKLALIGIGHFTGCRECTWRTMENKRNGVYGEHFPGGAGVWTLALGHCGIFWLGK